MSASAVKAKKNASPSASAVDAGGNNVDLSDFEESYYRADEVQTTLERYKESKRVK